ncbi:MAG: hypothetical protein WD885_00020 [Candidatus Saccharimonadales bacterium]
MNDVWFESLVILLSIMLGLFLLLAIILVVKIIQIVSQIKRIVDHAEQAVDKAEHIASFFEKTATPVAFIKLISNISDYVTKAAGKAKKRGKDDA